MTSNENASSVEAHGQEQSVLFRIPQEMRDSIYSHLLIDTRIWLGRDWVRAENVERVRIVTDPNALSLLRTCRRVKVEVGHSWIGKVLFTFQSPERMMEKLTTIPRSKLSQIRHLRINGETAFLWWNGREENEARVYYWLPAFMKFLPGLRLDTLTIMDGSGDLITYEGIDALVKYGEGWKQLRCISHSSKILGVKCYRSEPGDFLDEYRRKHQPADWMSIMTHRDGAETQPSVQVYRSTQPANARPDKVGLVTDERTRLPYAQQAPEPGSEAAQMYGLVQDADLMSSAEERNKELMVVVTRGKGVDYEVKENSPRLPKDIGDIRDDCPNMTWAQIQKEHIEWVDDTLLPVVADAYRHADDYDWTQLHPGSWD